MKYFLFLFVMSLSNLFAQAYQPSLFSFKEIEEKKTTTPSLVRICAVMVEFQTDNDGTTYGDGKFNSIYSENHGTSIIDPLPHDKTYFESHLEFAVNYFNKVSKGKTQIQYTVLPNIITVNQTMRNYSPPINSTDFTPIGNFAQEVWTKADSAHPGFNFNQYDLFAIFHAGVGRDVSLPGSLGNERDIPSVYLGLNKLQEFFGSSFSGFDVSNNTFKISNSMILPQTESREQSTFGGKVLYEITINGLIASSIGSYLGLPDLFDTKTGLSAIGRFGLMDGQAIFAYNGAFPPEPSAWEKIFLGWETPVVLNNFEGDLNLTASAFAGLADTTIVKIPIGNKEYFLVENRQRDVNNNGAKVIVVNNGAQHTLSFPKDTTGFYSYDIRDLDGVVINVDEFDWALPGKGIVVWHIDDNIIEQKISVNQVNANPSLRGVDVEEADGIQDIGVEFQTIFGDILVGEGTDEDFWFSGNDAELYKNRFSSDTRPSSKTNADANTQITLKNFSSNGNKMSFTLSKSDAEIKFNFSKNLASLSGTIWNDRANNSLTILPSVAQSSSNKIEADELLLFADTKLYRFNHQGNLIDSIQNFSTRKPTAFSNGSFSLVVGCKDDKINLLIKNGTSTSLKIFTASEAGLNFNTIYKTASEQIYLFIGTNSGKILKYSLQNILSDQLDFISKDSLSKSGEVAKVVVSEDGYFVVQKKANGGYHLYENTKGYFFESSTDTFFNASLTYDENGKKLFAISHLNSNPYFFKEGEKFAVSLINNYKNNLMIADLNSDGNNYFVVNSDVGLEALNLSGSNLDNFPLSESVAKNGFAVAQLSANNSAHILGSNLGSIYAVNSSNGKLDSRFPLQISTGTGFDCPPIFYSTNGSDLALLAIDDQANLISWTLGTNSGKVFWNSDNGSLQNNSVFAAASSSNKENRFFPASKCYNYPNPVYGAKTFIRYFVNENSSIKIKIFDLAGDFVAELNDNAIGGMDNETALDVSSIQSGVYLASVEATGSSGKTETNIIKIAVVK